MQTIYNGFRIRCSMTIKTSTFSGWRLSGKDAEMTIKIFFGFKLCI